MLLLKRRQGETIIIDDNIKVTVMELNGNQIRIGIDAPEYIAIYREELYERMQTETKHNKDADAEVF